MPPPHTSGGGSLVPERQDMDHFPIVIPGTAIPQGSKSVTRTGVMYEANPKLKDWRAHCTAILTAWTGTWFGAWEPYDGPLLVDVTFYLPKPKRPKFQLPAVKPDGDKLQRALGDSLTAAGVIVDDARITQWRSRKRYAGERGPRVTIHNIAPDKEEP